jgi:signal transduction histidine kinase
MTPVFMLAALTLATAIVAAYFWGATIKLKAENRRLKKTAEESENEYRSHLEELTATGENKFLEATDILQNERERIANELHDDIVQRLIAVRFRLEQLLHFFPRPEIEQEINLLRGELESAMGDLRYVIRDLKHPKLEGKDLNILLTDMVEKLKLITSIKFDLDIQNAEEAFPVPAEVTKELYLLAKEAVQNALKHSAGFEIRISVQWKPDLIIEITNDGVIFLNAFKPNIGLNSMRERCSKIGASFEKFNRPGNPFHAVVKITLPSPVHQTSPLR